jgi:hypothetical protein
MRLWCQVNDAGPSSGVCFYSKSSKLPHHALGDLDGARPSSEDSPAAETPFSSNLSQVALSVAGARIFDRKKTTF